MNNNIIPITMVLLAIGAILFRNNKYGGTFIVTTVSIVFNILAVDIFGFSEFSVVLALAIAVAIWATVFVIIVASVSNIIANGYKTVYKILLGLYIVLYIFRLYA